MQNNIKVIIDANLWISFLIKSKSSVILRNIITDRNIVLVMTERLKQELLTVASRDKFKKYFSAESVEKLSSFIDKYSTDFIIGDIPQRCRDSKDDYLLELAVVSDADYLITGDKDLLEIEHIANCKIVPITFFA
ncbi:MAG: putative toxin-antitoxin system toxin component, PIN family [Bacteroidales bacterium]|nr:putative toxin-antitoxin system toxin component, PIN family [Bacteroidales bacterium]